MTLKIGVLMDAIETIKPYKDSTFSMMLAAQARGHQLYYFQQHDVFVEAGIAKVSAQSVSVTDNSDDYYQLGEAQTGELAQFDAILMRKDPPFDMEYIYTTYMLELAEQQGTLIVNPPQALRAVNEKFSITHFPDLTPKTLISRDMNKIRAFIEAEGRAVVKPMDGMGGAGIFKVSRDDANTNAILETLGNGDNTLMVQAYLDKVTEGDKRILLVDGQAPEHSVARIPQGKEFRANLAAGGKAVVQTLTERERQVCERVKPWVQSMGLLFVGLDVIDGHITEINVTSPTCIREIEQATDENIAVRLIEAIERRVG
ncbi:MAG: glutathione synthase [Gammaproteobacteria bacterium]|nr:MAG: glutathione synthase [Gammaproteobacteria bacterium]